MKILITGATGFIGKNLIPLLNKRYNVTGLAKTNGKNIINHDLTKKIDLTGFDVVIHLAWSKNYDENILIIKNLIYSCKNSKIKKLIVLSSMSSKRKYPDNYGKTKKKIEDLVKNSGINYTILRPSIIYGSGSTSFSFILNYLKNLPFVPIIGTGRYAIYPVYIGDVVKSINNCINNKKTNRKEYDLPGAEKIYFLELINELKKASNIHKPNIKIPLLLCRIFSIFIPGILSKENLRNITEDSLADSSEARKDFKYNPISFREGVKHGLI